VRVTYADISNTAALIEIAKEKYSYMPELSFGTHFFQDLVEAGIVYLPLYPGQEGVVFKEGFFNASPNRLAEILPKYARLSDVLKVIDIEASGRSLSIHMNSELERAVAFFSREQKGQPALSEKEIQGERFEEIDQKEHWQWRRYMARQLADSMDMEALGVKGIYLFGSTNTERAGMGSDIDLLIHLRDKKAPAALEPWLDGWSRALGRINFLQTGYDAKKLLDFHIITDEDIALGNPFAIKINSPTDPATPLRLSREDGEKSG
jgi:pyruvate,water dikinase